MYRICFWNKRNAVKIFLAFKFFFVLLNVMFYTSQRWTLYGSWPGRVTVNDSQTWFLGNYTEHCQTFMLPNVEVVNVTERYRYRVKQLCPCVPETLSKSLLHYGTRAYYVCEFCIVLYCIFMYLQTYEATLNFLINAVCTKLCRYVVRQSVGCWKVFTHFHGICSLKVYAHFEGICSLKVYAV